MQKIKIFALYVILLIVCIAINAQADDKVQMLGKRAVLGHIERVNVGKAAVTLEALLSSSHQGSELGVLDLKIKKSSSGKEYAHYRLKGRKGKTISVKTPVIAREKKGVIVRVPICLASYSLHPEVLLTERSKFPQEMRLGRRVLAGRVVIDLSLTHASVPTCGIDTPGEEKEATEEVVEASDLEQDEEEKDTVK